MAKPIVLKNARSKSCELKSRRSSVFSVRRTQSCTKSDVQQTKNRIYQNNILFVKSLACRVEKCRLKCKWRYERMHTIVGEVTSRIVKVWQKGTMRYGSMKSYRLGLLYLYYTHTSALLESLEWYRGMRLLDEGSVYRMLKKDAVFEQLEHQMVWLCALVQVPFVAGKVVLVIPEMDACVLPCERKDDFVKWIEQLKKESFQRVLVDEKNRPSEAMVFTEHFVQKVLCEKECLGKRMEALFYKMIVASDRERKSILVHDHRQATVRELQKCGDGLGRSMNALMACLYQELKQKIKNGDILKLIIEHVVFPRFGIIYYWKTRVYLSEQNQKCHVQCQMIRLAKLSTLGFPSNVPENTMVMFPKALAMFQQIGMVMPSEAKRQLMDMIEMIHLESNVMSKGFMVDSGETLLPVLVYILCHSNVRSVFSLLHVLENNTTDLEQIGSECTYYVACLQSAALYIMAFV